MFKPDPPKLWEAMRSLINWMEVDFATEDFRIGITNSFAATGTGPKAGASRQVFSVYKEEDVFKGEAKVIPYVKGRPTIPTIPVVAVETYDYNGVTLGLPTLYIDSLIDDEV